MRRLMSSCSRRPNAAAARVGRIEALSRPLRAFGRGAARLSCGVMRHGKAHHMNDGFAIVPDVFDGAELDEIAHDLATASLQRSRAGARHLLAIPTMATLARDPRLAAVAAEVLGS